MKSNKRRIVLQFMKFALVGISNVAVDNGLYWLLSSMFGVDFRIAKTISYTCGMVNSWFWNSKWTFKQEKADSNSTKKLIGFVIVNIISMGVQILVLALFDRFFGKTSVWISLFFATPSSLLLNFFGNKLFVFK